MRKQEHSLFYGIDTITVLTYALLVFMGWLNIYAAVYNEEHQNIFDTSQKYGMQLIWISSAFFIAILILIIDAGFYTVFAYFFYAFLLLACIAVPYLGREVKGSRSWFRFGSFGIQPAEFMKFATNLALAKYLSNVNIEVQTSRRNKLTDLLKNYKNTIIAVIILGLPLLIIKILQDETGLAIVFIAFIITLYREGLSVNFLIAGIFSAILFVLSLVLASQTLIIALGIIGLLAFLFIKRSRKNLIFVSIFFVSASVVVLGTNYVYNHLEDHQRIRIDVLLGRGTVNLKKEGYNVNQAKIAIGSGGFFWKRIFTRHSN